MPSTYSTRLRLEQQATGENRLTWGTKANAVFSRLEEAIAAWTSAHLGTSVSTEYTLTANQGSSDQARSAVLKLTGSLASSVPIIVPAVEKHYYILNQTTGQPLLIKPLGGTAVSVEYGWSQLITDGVTFYNVVSVSPNVDVNTCAYTSAAVDARFARLSATQEFTAQQRVSAPLIATMTLDVSGSVDAAGNVDVSGTLSATNLRGTSATFTNVATTSLDVTGFMSVTNMRVNNIVSASAFVGNGAGLTNLSVTGISVSVSNAGPGGIKVLLSASNGVVVARSFSRTSANFGSPTNNFRYVHDVGISQDGNTIYLDVTYAWAAEPGGGGGP